MEKQARLEPGKNHVTPLSNTMLYYHDAVLFLMRSWPPGWGNKQPVTHPALMIRAEANNWLTTVEH